MRWRKVLIVVLLGVFLYSSYEIFTYYYEAFKSKSTYDEVRKLYQEQLQFEGQQESEGEKPAQPVSTPEQENSPGKKEAMARYTSLLEMNEDVVGWISVPGTVIDYPVVQARDNDYYLRRDIHGKSARAGTIFMDYRSDKLGKGKNTILYGHHMRNGSMFKDLVKYKREDFFQKNGYIRFDTLYEEIEWEVFSVYITEVDFPYGQTAFDSDEEYITFLEGIKGRSMFEKDIELTEEAQILTLSTCTYEYDNARLVVHARRVRE